MIREIKFRAWDYRSKSMIKEVFEVGLGDRNNPEKWLVGDDKQIDNFRLLQFINLKDRNGKEIYEGDIVKKWLGCYTIDLKTGKESQDEEGIFEIKFNELHCCFGLFYDDGYCGGLIASEYNNKGKRHIDWRCDHIEVIGNIYENPELINE